MAPVWRRFGGGAPPITRWIPPPAGKDLPFLRGSAPSHPVCSRKVPRMRQWKTNSAGCTCNASCERPVLGVSALPRRAQALENTGHFCRGSAKCGGAVQPGRKDLEVGVKRPKWGECAPIPAGYPREDGVHAVPLGGQRQPEGRSLDNKGRLDCVDVAVAVQFTHPGGQCNPGLKSGTEYAMGTVSEGTLERCIHRRGTRGSRSD